MRKQEFDFAANFSPSLEEIQRDSSETATTEATGTVPQGTTVAGETPTDADFSTNTFPPADDSYWDWNDNN